MQAGGPARAKCSLTCRFDSARYSGAAEVPYPRFLALSALGGVPWIAFWGILGRVLGSHYNSIKSHLHYIDIAAVVLIVAALIYFAYRRHQRRSRVAT